MRLGAHVSASGGLDKAIDRAADIGAEAAQIFVSSPRMWRFRNPPEKETVKFKEKSKERDVAPVFIHGSYLVNLGGGEELLGKSVDVLSKSMQAAGTIGAAGVIFHGGAHKGAGFEGMLPQAVSAMRQVLSVSPEGVWLIVENSAGMGSHIGSSFAEIGRLMAEVGSPRVKVCLDTQHSMASGYDLADEDGLARAMDEFESEIGLSNLVAVHANDSKVAFGSGVDRHENIGEGHLGIAGFETIMAHEAFHDVPFILEVPGFEKNGPDKENMERIKDIRSRLGIPA
jgi:deoxyribonuclease-4